MGEVLGIRFDVMVTCLARDEEHAKAIAIEQRPAAIIAFEQRVLPQSRVRDGIGRWETVS
jgi:hypothetical protein